jgi:hypothetical protein
MGVGPEDDASVGPGAAGSPGAPFCWPFRFLPTPSRTLKAMKRRTMKSPEKPSMAQGTYSLDSCVGASSSPAMD